MNENPEEAKDRLIETLKSQLDSLGSTLRYIDADVDRAVAKYLNPTVPYGKLKFKDFIDLLVLEVKRSTRREMRQNTKFREELTDNVRKGFHKRLDMVVDSLLPEIKGKLSDYIKIKILLTCRKKNPIPFARNQEPPVWDAKPVRSTIKHGKGWTPEAAYDQFRERMILELFSLGTSDFAHALVHFDVGLDAKFKVAKPFRTEVIEGYEVEVRIEEKADEGQG